MAGPGNSGSRPVGDGSAQGDTGVAHDRDVIADRDVAHDRDVIADRDVAHDRDVTVRDDVRRDPDATMVDERTSGQRFQSEHTATERADAAGDPHRQAGEDRARERFGGFNWGAAFFGWLVAVGIATLLTAALSAAGAAIGLTQVSGDEATQNAETIGIVGGILLLAVLMIAYYAGGYVAGRMSRFDGGRQGVGTWVIGLLVTIALAVAGAVLGSEFNLLAQVNLPSIPVGEGTLTTGGIIALAAIVLGTLLAAFLGGKAGTHYHRKVDDAGRI
ncbi:MAG: hypothetical protein AVDCRST_MAG38-2518 [uncultured Solirubrobacteraceae bacterium]|uniref:Uncharacterized protein n=1 Tax=uncultured Solirubrobacteraceae bacterium TaxID=1162706 RepID=A0A6J4S3S2_9ACTN|nr:MAG: hypothetical protein AVDCRST_MAG38-2518 [uncultured Solirubrobacteraceae bacterium]